MPSVPRRSRSRVPYWVRFSITVFGLTAVTSAFVLVVLPQRFVLQAGLIESGITFPATTPPFVPGSPPQVRRPPPDVARTAPPPPPIRAGPAEQFWASVLPILRAGELDRALPQFRAYLAAHPDDRDVWRELAVVLARLGRYDEAETIYVRLRRTSDDAVLTLQLARLLRDRGDPERSLALYDTLLVASPGDVTLLVEHAQTLTWAERYARAAAVYRHLLERDSTNHAARLELAHVLYWDGRRTEALEVLAAMPSDASQGVEALQLKTVIARELASVGSPADTLLDGARRAVIAGDFDDAVRRYERLLARNPNDAALWLEWADVLQYQMQDLAAARDALRHLATLRDLSVDERFRLVQLHAWTGEETRAKAMLVTLLEEDSTRVEGWALLGDLYRFRDARIEARNAYRTALTLDPGSVPAREGQTALERQAARVLENRERPSAGPEILYFRDSDEFERMDLGAHASYQWGSTVLLARAGYRRLEGIALGGASGQERGPYFQLEFARWWRLGSLRTSVSVGVEHLAATGTEPTFAVAVALPEANGTAIEVSYDHGPAFHRTVTLESVLGAIQADHVQASVFRSLGPRWDLSGLGAVTSLRGSAGDNWRFNSFVTLRRELAGPFTIALTSQALAFTTAAPTLGSRRLYWDPQAF
ncbi:MAG: tetratricopeptide repeat protein, partial [Gemmatimonadota bacterium]|nr:tetratricopeptide repeat protein [Gemmatimonadota bacterium]